MKKLFLVLLLLAGCASQPIETQLNTGAQVLAGANRSVASALDAHMITSNDATHYQGIALHANAILNSARDLKDSDPTTAEGKIKLVNDIIRELQDYLVSLLEKKP
jgi:hypothetical protein